MKNVKKGLLELRKNELKREIIVTYSDKLYKLYFVKAYFKNTIHMEVYTEYQNNYFRNMYYIYKNIGRTLDYKYLNWKNLSCCDGFITDKEYIKTSVQNGTKLLAGLSFYQTEVKEALDYIDKNKDNADFTLIYKEDDRKITHIDIVRNGMLAEFYNFNEIKVLYKELLPELDDYIECLFNKKNILYKMFNTNMKKLIESNTYDYVNPSDNSEFIFTGLILGYPIESTAYLISR